MGLGQLKVNFYDGDNIISMVFEFNALGALIFCDFFNPGMERIVTRPKIRDNVSIIGILKISF